MVGFERSDEQKKYLVNDPCNLLVFLLFDLRLSISKKGRQPPVLPFTISYGLCLIKTFFKPNHD
jgi:hypothetical protein